MLFRSSKARLGTNPICFAVPSNLEGPLFFDMATSAAAAGKINVATARGEQVPPGWLIDAQGKPSTDPRVLRQGGALLPVGGSWTSWTNCGPPWHRIIFPNVNCQSLKLPGSWDIARSALSLTHSNVGLERHQRNFDRKRRHLRLEPL